MTDSTAHDTGEGSRAYTAYGTAVRWKTHDGRPMPGWFDLGPTVQAGWIAVGKLITGDVASERARCPDLVCVLIEEWRDGISPDRLAELVVAMRDHYDYGGELTPDSGGVVSNDG